MTRKQATCTCELCYDIVPKAEARQETVSVQSGNSHGSSKGSMYLSTNDRLKSSRTSERTYYRNKIIWICDECWPTYNEARASQNTIGYIVIAAMLILGLILIATSGPR